MFESLQPDINRYPPLSEADGDSRGIESDLGKTVSHHRRILLRWIISVASPEFSRSHNTTEDVMGERGKIAAVYSELALAVLVMVFISTIYGGCGVQ